MRVTITGQEDEQRACLRARLVSVKLALSNLAERQFRVFGCQRKG
jgi:hypothetical protein